MRKGAIYFLIGLAVVTGVMLYFFRDRYLERAVESACEAANGAKVEIDNFHFSLFRLTCKFDRLQWTDAKDTWTNLFETGPVEFGVELRPLFWKKLIVREAKVSGILLGTKRATDGWIPAPPAEPGIVDEVIQSVEHEIKTLPVLNLGALKQKLNLDSLLNIDQLAVVQSVQTIRSEGDTAVAKWQQFIKTYDAQAKITALQTQAQAIDVQSLKTADEFAANLQRASRLREDAVALRNEVTSNKKSAEQDFNRIVAILKNIDNLAAQDFAAAKARLGFGDFNVKDAGKMLFGNPFAGRFSAIMRYLDLGREYLPTAKMLMSINKVENPPRFKGQDISFPRTFSYPKFLLRHALISGATNAEEASAWQIQGETWGITSEPPVYGKPTVVDLQLFKEAANAYQVRGVLDHVTEVAKDTLNMRASNFRLGEMNLRSDKPYLPASLQAGRGEVSAMFALSGNAVHSRVDMRINQVGFQFAAATADPVVETIRTVFRPIEQLRLLAEVQGPSDALQIHIGSNLDEVFAARLSDLLKASLGRAEDELRQRINQEAAKRRQQAEALLAEKQKLVMDELNKYQVKIEEQLAVLESKKQEIENRLKAEQDKVAGEAKKKLKKALEGIKKP